MTGPGSELDAVGKVAEAFLARFRRGERPSLTEYTENHPELAEHIRDLFPALVVMEEFGSVEGPPAGPSAEIISCRGASRERLGDYRILRQVGRGGMGIVYEAVQESLGRHVALKVLSSHGALSPTNRERFRREARASARLHHTNIVPVHGVGEHEGVPYYAMQFIRGQGLDEVLEEVRRLRGQRVSPPAGGPGPCTDESRCLAEGLLSGEFSRAGARSRVDGAPAETPTGVSAGAPGAPPIGAEPARGPATDSSASGTELTAQSESQYFRSVARMGTQVAAGLDYAHKQGVLHRDIKPSNLLLDACGTVWITDFGLAKAEGTDELTDTGDIVGTVRYMAPERFRGWSDPRSDVYSLGITLYELLTLRPAFDDSDRPRLIERVAHEDPPRPRKVDRSIPRDLETIVLKAIDKEPGRRYQTAAELAADLARFLASEPVRARRVGILERGVKWVKRWPSLAALLAVSTAAVLALVVGTLHHNARLGAALRKAEANLEMASVAEAQSRLAERETTRQLAIAHLREAQARRNGGLVGRRFESLEALERAAEHFRALGQLDEPRILELRNEAIACLRLVDLKPGKDWTRDPGWSRLYGFDPTLQYYVTRSTADDHPEDAAVHRGHLRIRRVADDREVAFLPGFGVRVVATWFSPDSRYLAANYEWGQCQNYVWDLSRRTAILSVSQGHHSLASFSPDSRLVALARPDRSIRIYELPSGTTWKDLPPGPQVDGVHFHPDGRRLAIVSDRLVQLRDLSDGKNLATFRHPDHIRMLAWRSDGEVFATGCEDHDIYVWDVAQPAQPLRTFKGHRGSVFNLAFSHGGDLLLSASWDSTNRLWDARTGQPLLSTPGGLDCTFGPDDREVDHGWRLATGRECRTFHAPKELKWVAISPGGRLIASAGADGVRLWDLSATREGDKELAILPVGLCVRARFDPKGESLITDGRAGLQRWPIAQDPETDGLRIGPPQAVGLSARASLSMPAYDPDFALSADGRTIAHVPHRGQVLLYGLEDPRRKLLIASPYLRFPAFSPDGRWLATGNWQGRRIKVWEARTGRLAHDLDLDEPGEKTAWPAFSPDGKWLVTGTFSEYRFWEVGSWRKRHALPRENGTKTVGWIVFSLDGKMLAVLHGVSEVHLIDPTTGRLFARLPTSGGPYGFSSDGSHLMTYAGRDGAFEVWDLRLIRRQLAEMGLDWDLPSLPPCAEEVKPLRVRVSPAERPLPSAELDARARLERGLLYVQLRQYALGWADFERASTLDPERNPWVEALQAHSQAIERNPNEAEAYHWRAHTHERLGRWEEAIDDHSRAIELDARRRGYLVCRRRAYLSTGQIDRAAEDLREAHQEDEDQMSRLARWLLTAPTPLHREPTLALELAKELVRRAPRVAVYWNTLGVAHYRLGEWKAAIQALEEAEKLASRTSYGSNAFVLAICHHQLGHHTEARNSYDRAVRWCQDDHDSMDSARKQELQAFHAEAEALLNRPRRGR
jgi:serine/threonine protein kinase/WD40 repeat protein/tetratricopeptide (TPR) repeat protein